MKNQKSNKAIIRELKLMEAEAWIAYKNQERLCVKVCGEDKSTWAFPHLDLYRMYLHEWLPIHKILDKLEIEPFSWTERKHLQELNLMTKDI